MILTAASLFAGIGGIDLAFQRAGMRMVAAVEIDQAARGVITDRMPHVTLLNDVTEVTGEQLLAAGFDPRTGVIAAGWPCQGNSVAGRRQGMDDPRSGLWVHIVRLLAELHPAWFLGENVPGLYSVNAGRDIAVVRSDLAQLGYWWAERILDSQHFGVPQRRRRVFIVGHFGDRAAPVQVLLEPEGGGRDTPPRTPARQDIAGTLGGGSGKRGWADDLDRMTFLPVAVSALTRSMAGGGGADDNTAQGGHLIPFDAAQITHPKNRVNPQPGDPAAPLTATGKPMVAETLRSHPRPGSNSNGALVAHTLTADGADASEDGTGRGVSIIPMAFDWQSGGDVRHSYGERPSALHRRQAPAVHVRSAVRRLTPLECERLQGFPDGWTATSDGKPQSDSARYRQLGNAVAVPVVEWIAHRMLRVMSDDREE